MPKGAICCVASWWQSIYFSGNAIYFAEAVLELAHWGSVPKGRGGITCGVIDQSKFPSSSQPLSKSFPCSAYCTVTPAHRNAAVKH